MSFQEIMDMPQEAFYMYAKAIPILQSRELLPMLTVSDFPHLKKDRRNSLHKEIYKVAHPSIFESKTEALDTKSLVSMLAGMIDG